MGKYSTFFLIALISLASAQTQQYYCRGGPDGPCFEFRSEDYPNPESHWRTSFDIAYTNDLVGFTTFCKNWESNADVFNGGQGSCADVGVTCTDSDGSSACGSTRCVWADPITASIPDHNLHCSYDKTLAECKQLCEEHEDCKAVELRESDGHCCLSDCQIGDGSGCEIGNDVTFQYYACNVELPTGSPSVKPSEIPTGSPSVKPSGIPTTLTPSASPVTSLPTARQTTSTNQTLDFCPSGIFEATSNCLTKEECQAICSSGDGHLCPLNACGCVSFEEHEGFCCGGACHEDYDQLYRANFHNGYRFELADRAIQWDRTQDGCKQACHDMGDKCQAFTVEDDARCDIISGFQYMEPAAQCETCWVKNLGDSRDNGYIHTEEPEEIESVHSTEELIRSTTAVRRLLMRQRKN